MIILLNFLAIAVIVLFILGTYKHQRSFLDLGIMFSIFLFIEYPLRVLILYFFPHYAIPSYSQMMLPNNLFRTCVLQLLGIIGFCFGYYVIVTRRKRSRFLDSAYLKKDRKDIAILFVIYLISIAAKIYKIYTGNYISFLIGENLDMRWANLIENLHMLGWVCFAAVWGLLLQRRLRSAFHYIFFTMVNITELSYQIIQGSKTFMILPLFIIIVVYYYYRKRIPYAVMIFTAIFSFFFVFPFVHNFRKYILFNYGLIPSIQQFDIANTVNKTFYYTKAIDEPLYMKFFESFTRIAGADELFSITQLVPGMMPFKHGRDFMAIIYGFIPRAIWLNKPSYSLGAEYGVALGYRAAITPYPIGQMFWDFGVWGTFLGMFVWGLFTYVCMIIFNRFFAYNRSRIIVMSIFLAECYWLTTGESMFYTLIASVIKKVVIYFCIYQFAKFLISGNKLTSSFMAKKSNSINIQNLGHTS